MTVPQTPDEQLTNKTVKVDILLGQFQSRRQRRTRNSRRMGLWRFTVRCSYMLKRLIDIIGSSLAILLLSPLFLVVALLIKLTSKGPIFFVQMRVGKYGRFFRF